MKFTSVRAFLSLASHKDCEIHQLDVKTAFLYGELKEEVYLRLAEGMKAEEGKILRPKKSLYGLK